MARFWVYVGDKVQGPVDIPSLRKISGFNLLSQVCQEGEQTWRMADEVIEIKSYFISPPRPNSFALDTGNAAPKLDPAPPPILEELTLPEPNMSWQKGGDIPLKDKPEPAGVPVAQTGPMAGLRALCDVCGYKNPRDVTVCMKCGEKLKGAAAPSASPATTTISAPIATGGMPKAVEPVIPAPVPAAAAPVSDPSANAMVELSMGKLLAGTAVAAVILAGSFLGYRSWRKHHLPRPVPRETVPAEAPVITKRVSKKPSSAYNRRRAPISYRYKASAMPSVSKKTVRLADENAAEQPDTETAAYRVVPEAAPLKKRFSSPINSPYAMKRRANQDLWTAQEDQAIKQVQRTRIYGGLRTIDRNVEILMQILRDREYNTAFESGRRIYLYNDLDWSAVLKEGPVYEVRLTFSGGREADGSPKKPLHFAFLSDLERGTVEGGGQDQVRSNTLHAFFDESRIAPEERRAIAKDTEELVLAAQPGASPLALDTVVRQFAKVYTTAALSRVANAYDLALVKKRLMHDTKLGSDEPVLVPVAGSASAEPAAATMFGSQVMRPEKSSESVKKPSASVEEAKPSKAVQAVWSGKGGEPEFRMETGAGRERTVLVRATSRASVGRIWEVLTGYDRLKQFMPDMLASEREGQDGAATIVHTVCLTRFMIFMFKVNLHLRVIEHPREHTLEFERIAGEFESFRGSVEVTSDPATHDSLIAFHATLVPTGRMMNWTLEKMARRLLVPQIEAIRAKAESN